MFLHNCLALKVLLAHFLVVLTRADRTELESGCDESIVTWVHPSSPFSVTVPTTSQCKKAVLSFPGHEPMAINITQQLCSSNETTDQSFQVELEDLSPLGEARLLFLCDDLLINYCLPLHVEKSLSTTGTPATHLQVVCKSTTSNGTFSRSSATFSQSASMLSETPSLSGGPSSLQTPMHLLQSSTTLYTSTLSPGMYSESSIGESLSDSPGPSLAHSSTAPYPLTPSLTMSQSLALAPSSTMLPSFSMATSLAMAPSEISNSSQRPLDSQPSRTTLAIDPLSTPQEGARNCTCT
jgi:hypothetical protein